MPENKLITVFKGNTFEANFVKGLLEDAGIQAFLNNDNMGNIAPWQVASGGVGAVGVVISELDIYEAEPIIKKFHDDLKKDN